MLVQSSLGNLFFLSASLLTILLFQEQFRLACGGGWGVQFIASQPLSTGWGTPAQPAGSLPDPLQTKETWTIASTDYFKLWVLGRFVMQLQLTDNRWVPLEKKGQRQIFGEIGASSSFSKVSRHRKSFCAAVLTWHYLFLSDTLFEFPPTSTPPHSHPAQWSHP